MVLRHIAPILACASLGACAGPSVQGGPGGHTATSTPRPRTTGTGGPSAHTGSPGQDTGDTSATGGSDDTGGAGQTTGTGRLGGHATGLTPATGDTAWQPPHSGLLPPWIPTDSDTDGASPACPAVDPWETTPLSAYPLGGPVLREPYLTGVQADGDTFVAQAAQIDGGISDIDPWQVAVPPGCTLTAEIDASGPLHLRLDAPGGARLEGFATTRTLTNEGQETHIADLIVSGDRVVLPYTDVPRCVPYDLSLALACASETGETGGQAQDTATQFPTSGSGDTVYLYRVPIPGSGGLGGRTGADALARAALPRRLTAQDGASWAARAFLSHPGDALIDLPSTSGLPSQATVVGVDEAGATTQLATTWQGLFDGRWDATAMAAVGLPPSNLVLLSGTASDGSTTGRHCDGWRSASLADTFSAGSTNRADGTALDRPRDAGCLFVWNQLPWLGGPSHALLGVAWCDGDCEVPAPATCPTDAREAHDASGGTAVLIGPGDDVSTEGVVLGTETDVVRLERTDPDCWMQVTVEGDDAVLEGATLVVQDRGASTSRTLVSGEASHLAQGALPGEVVEIQLTGLDPGTCLPWTVRADAYHCP